MKRSQLGEEQRLCGSCLQLLYVFTLDVVSLARAYHRRADEISADFSLEKTIGGMHGEDVNFVSEKKFVSRFGHDCKIG